MRVAVFFKIFQQEQHDHACSKCLLLQVFNNSLVVSRLRSGPRLVGRIVPVFKEHSDRCSVSHKMRYLQFAFSQTEKQATQLKLT